MLALIIIENNQKIFYIERMIQAYKCPAPKEKLALFEYEPLPLGPHDIRVKITHCGICHSDIHLIDDDWKISKYPLVPGHEIVGTIEEVGKDSKHHLGDRIGIGWQGKSCFACEWCNHGDENLCPTQEPTCVGHFGGFAKEIVCDGRFAFLIPKELPSPFAAPLLCGGATVFSPMIDHNVTKDTRLAVVGIGGLGHLALQFAKTFGCEVTAISHSPDKENEAKKLGADNYLPLEKVETLKDAFDLILCTSIGNLDWPSFLVALRPRGKLCLLGIPSEPFQTPVDHLVDRRKIVCGSNIGSRAHITQMLETAAKKKVVPQIEQFPMDRVNEALDKVRAGKVRYRAVLCN